MSKHSLLVIAVVALAALAAWPSYFNHHTIAQASVATPAPVTADYLNRNGIIASFEHNAQRNRDQITTRMLASQYLMRYRETGDVGDLIRAEHNAARSLVLQPHFNMLGEMTMASAQLSLHRFHDARAHAREAMRIEPWNTGAIAQAASIDTELGFYQEADRLLRSTRPGLKPDPGVFTALARYDEVTGHTAEARTLMARTMVQMDSVVDNPAEARAWYHFRDGELAWSLGDDTSAEQRFREALMIFPHYARAYNGLARLYWGERRWHEAVDAATQAAELLPLPESLGYEADAQRALGDEQGARATQDLILAIERIGNASGLNDRGLAIYYSEHRIRLADALRIAKRDVAVRDDIFAEDTLAWALAQNGRWREAERAARKATRYDTQDARLHYHLGIITLRNGNRAEAQRELQRALALNAHFHPVYADDARNVLQDWRL
ncbi:MAG: hypothetical protein M3Z37_01505 [Candidatus Eremiobacteraeota bacterium]|nr:hypothetical protein [Candidatus Eremiobacteraeota bacterium]